MNQKTLRNFWLDIALFLLLVLDIAAINVTRLETAGEQHGFGLHAHIIISILLTLGCLIHIVMHWQWFRAVLTGKAEGKIKLMMTSLVTIMMLLAGLSGHGALTSIAASNLHSFTGSMALIGLSIHGIKHIRWVYLTAKRLMGNQHQLQPIHSTK